MRSSYSGTGTDCCDESWGEWLSQRKDQAATNNPGVVDDILRLIPQTISSENVMCLAADSAMYDASCLASFGAFSAAARRESRASVTSSSSVCSADILGLVHDVMDSHLCCRSDPSPQSHESRMETLSRDVCTLSDDLPWQCISGSSDMLTVLAATSFSLVKQQVTVSVRVINSAMFKVPNFNLQVCLDCEENPMAASFLHSSLPTTQEGVEYFQPGTVCVENLAIFYEFQFMIAVLIGNLSLLTLAIRNSCIVCSIGAIVDREFTFTVNQFQNLSAVVRILYPDLVVDLKAVEVFESVPFLPVAGSSHTANRDLGGPDDETGDGARTSKYKNSDVANVAQIDCVPLRIPLGMLTRTVNVSLRVLRR